MPCLHLSATVGCPEGTRTAYHIATAAAVAHTAPRDVVNYVGISPTYGNLNGVMKVGNALVASQEQSPPDHRANAAQDDLELVNAQHLGARHGPLLYRHGLHCQKVSSIRWADLAPTFLCSPKCSPACLIPCTMIARYPRSKANDHVSPNHQRRSVRRSRSGNEAHHILLPLFRGSSVPAHAFISPTGNGRMK